MSKKLSFEYSFTGSKTTNWEIGKDNLSTSKYYNINFFSRLFFNFLDPIIGDAQNENLELKDIPLANYFEDGDEERLWNRFKERCKKIKPDKDGNMDYGPALGGAMWDVCGYYLYLGTFLGVLNKCIELGRPQLYKMLLEYLYDVDASQSQGWLYANLYAFSIVLNAILSRQSVFYLAIVSTKMAQEMTKLCYRKVLRLGVEYEIDGGVGKLVNISSVDVGQAVGLFGVLPVAINAPLEWVLITYFIYREIGNSAFMMWGVLVLVLIIAGCLAMYMVSMIEKSYETSDLRVKAITEILNGIKLFKLYAWESMMQNRVEDLRSIQIGYRKAIFGTFVAMIALINLSAVMNSIGCFGGYMSLDNDLTVWKTMVCLSYFYQFGLGLMNVSFFAQAYAPYFASRTRIAQLWSQDELEEYLTKNDDDYSTIYEFKNATMSWANPKRLAAEEAKKQEEDAKKEEEMADKAQKLGTVDVEVAVGEEKEEGDKEEELLKTNFKLKGLDFQIQRGELTAIVGSVASGKSSIMNALVGEMYLQEGEVISRLHKEETIAYLPQKTYILNASIRENICMDIPYEEQKYVQALRNAALIKDINNMDDADKTEIGAKGINLSGGQKARVMIARALYQEADVYFLDDVLSAVDPDVGDEIFNRAITGAMMDATRVLVMNSHLHNLKKCDHIVIVEDGYVVAQGQYDELIEKYASLMAPKTANEERMNLEKKARTKRVKIKRTGNPKVTLVEEEERAFGKVSFDVYKAFLKNMYPDSSWGARSIFMFICMIALLAAIMSQLADFYIIFWSDMMQGTSDILGLSAISRTAQTLIWLVLNLFKLFSYVWCQYFIMMKCFDTSEVTHNKAFFGTLEAGLEYFDKTPVGRILNRFSSDTDSSDMEIPFSFQSLVSFSSTLIISCAVIFAAIWFTIPAVIVMIYIMYRLTKYYITSVSSLRRLQSTSRSPVVDILEELVGNYQTLRVAGYGDRYIKRHTLYVDSSVRAGWTYAMAQQWYSLRLQLLTTILLFAVVNLAVHLKENSPLGNPTFLALTLGQATTIFNLIQYLMEGLINFNNALIAVERLLEQADASPKEPDFKLPTDPDAQTWPSSGAIEFRDVSFKYRDDMPTRLFNLNLSIKGGEKIGICGRCGSGECPITMPLFRMYNHMDGSIFIDGVNTENIGANTLRK